jgi:glycosyltransferase involved in cell wall biosynthesis
MVSTFYPPHIGGIEYHVENLSKELVKKGHKVTVLTSALSEMPLSTMSPHGIEIIRVKTCFPFAKIYPPIGNQGFVLNFDYVLKKLINSRNIDIVHAHGHHYYMTWKTICAAKKIGVPVVLTLHGLDTLSRCNPVAKIGEKIFNRTIFRQELKYVSALIGLTPRITENAKKYGFVAKGSFSIPNGVNLSVFDSNIEKKFLYRQKYGLDLSKTIVLFIGRFSQVKGVCELAEAAKKVVRKNDQVFFIFVGGGPLASELRKALKPISAYSKIFDWTPENVIHEFYIASNIFVLPSKSEALPLTVLEAMAARLKIVATNVGGIPEILQNYPYKTSINKCRPDEISNAILRATEERVSTFNNQQLIKKGYMDEFNWEKISQQVEKIYELSCPGQMKIGVLPELFSMHVPTPQKR